MFTLSGITSFKTKQFRHQGVWFILLSDGSILIDVEELKWHDPRTLDCIKDSQENPEKFIAYARWLSALQEMDKWENQFTRFVENHDYLNSTKALSEVMTNTQRMIGCYECVIGNHAWREICKSTLGIKEQHELDAVNQEIEQCYLLTKSIEDAVLRRAKIVAMHEMYGKDPKHGFIYLYGSIEGQYKIGLSVNPDRRAIEIVPRTILPISPEMIHIFPTNHMKAAEDILHEKYESYRTKGEWFTLSESHVAEICAIKDMMFDWLPTATTHSDHAESA